MAGLDFYEQQMEIVRRLETMQPERHQSLERIRSLRLRYKLLFGGVLALGAGFVIWQPSCEGKPLEIEAAKVFEESTPSPPSFTVEEKPSAAPGGSTDKSAKEKTDGEGKGGETPEFVKGAFTIKEKSDGSFETKITNSPSGLTCYPKPEIVRSAFGLVARLTLERIESGERQTAYPLVSITSTPTSNETVVPFEIPLHELIWQ